MDGEGPAGRNSVRNSGKTMLRLLEDVANSYDLSDISTLRNPDDEELRE